MVMGFMVKYHHHYAIPLIQMIQIDANFLSGTIPNCFGIQQNNLLELTFADNQLEATNDGAWSFLSGLTNCSNLKYLDVSQNKLHGKLPDLIGNLSKNLFYLNLQFCSITGNIPESIGNLIGLSELGMNNNLLEGSVPSSIGSLKLLNQLDLSNNNLSGPIPVTLGNLTMLALLRLNGNAINEGIPSNLSSCPLGFLDLSHNSLTGAIPKALFLISTLSDSLCLDHNLLTGTIPPEVSNLRNLGKLDFSSNKMSGEIPISIGNCQNLQYLNVSGNFLRGSNSTISRTTKWSLGA